MKFLFLCLFFFATFVSGSSRWDPLDTLLKESISQRVFPGATAAVFNRSSLLYASAVGSFTYGVPPPATPTYVPSMTRKTLFDMASCTKVLSSTTAAALLVQQGLLDIDSPVATYYPAFAANGKGNVTIRHLLVHASGLPADPTPGFDTVKFGCPESSRPSPSLAFTCRGRCADALANEKLVRPPMSEYEYSDESMMAMMLVIGSIVKDKGLVKESQLRSDCKNAGKEGIEQCYFEAYVRLHVFETLGMKQTMFLPGQDLAGTIAPTQNDTEYRHKVVQGQVHDQNTYAMGGISGHAGVFSTLDDVVVFTRAWLFPEETKGFLTRSTVNMFSAQDKKGFSTRALGWNTNADDSDDRGWNHVCGTLSASTITHVGFTGTMICADPQRGLGLVLLTNRVYPDYSSASQMHDVRQKFSTLVQKIYDSSL